MHEPLERCSSLSRRSALRLIGAAAAASSLPAAVRAQASEFVVVPGANPHLSSLPVPSVVPLPKGAISSAYDVYHNHWCLRAADSKRQRKLMVLPAQEPLRWIVDELSHLPSDRWEWLVADEFGYLWIAARRRLLRLDPRRPDLGWMELSQELALSTTAITAIGVAPSGAALVALSKGMIAEVDYTTRPIVTPSPAPVQADRLGSDPDGNTWLKSNGRWFRRASAPDAWQRRWEMAARLPGGNHDLAGDNLGDHFVMAGGQNAGWGYPALPHAFDSVWLLDARTRSWRVLGTLSHPRFYNGTTVLRGDVWVIGGNRRDADGTAHFLSTVEICDPLTGAVRKGPSLPFALEMPASARVDGRIYVAGGADEAIQTAVPGHIFRGPGKLLSIGGGESTWRTEPDAPVSFNALAAAAMGTSIYIATGKDGLCRFDTATRHWTKIGGQSTPRSPQMAAWNGEIWLMGGRDIQRVTQTVIYNPVQDAWRNGPELPRELAWGAGGVFDGRLMVAGGAAGRCYNNRTFLLR